MNGPTTFAEVREIMLQPAPMTDEEIEELLNQSPMLPSEELPLDEPQ